MQKAGQTGSLNLSIIISKLHFPELVQPYCQLHVHGFGALILLRWALPELGPDGILRQVSNATLDLEITLQVPLHPVVQIFLHGEGPRF
jgi:hypothetical protein